MYPSFVFLLICILLFPIKKAVHFVSLHFLIRCRACGLTEAGYPLRLAMWCHTKNFSFRLKKEGNWELAPAYDVCHAYKPDHRWVSQHALSINGKRTDITKEDLLVIGKSIKNKKAVSIIEEINDTVSQWKKFANDVDVLPEIRDEIAKTLINWK